MSRTLANLLVTHLVREEEEEEEEEEETSTTAAHGSSVVSSEAATNPNSFLSLTRVILSN